MLRDETILSLALAGPDAIFSRFFYHILSGLTPFVSSQSMQKRMEKPTSVEMDQWTRSLSKGAPQSRLCVKSRTILHLDAALNWLSRPTAGQDICHWRGQNRCQIT